MIGRIALLLAAMLTAILSVGVAFFAAETTATAEPTNVTSIADSRILQNAPTTNYGTTTLGADGDEPTGSGKDKYGLLRWDLASIAPGTKISSASVTLTVTNSSTQTYQAYALKRGWTESEVTWNSYAAGKPWEVAGAKGSLDREATVAGTVTPSATGERTFALSAAVVQRWVDDPSTNQGIIIANATNTDGFDFYSRESSTSSQRPRLTLNVEGVDNTAPETTIDSAPSDIFSNPSASFTFSSNEVNSTFECRLDGATFSTCTSPKSYSSLADGSHLFEVRATDAAGNADTTPASHTWVVDSSSSQNDPVLVGAGDIASCASSGDEATAKLLDGISGTVFSAGDNAYADGTAAEFTNCYNPSWGRHKARTYPAPGNHEYHTAGASGYFGYFGAAAGDPSKGYYSYDLGQWHIVALNSMCDQVGGCTESSPMVMWLKQDLAANPKTCTLAYFHHPLFSSGEHGNQTFMKPTWDALYAANADVVLSGHDHHYERFAPQTPSGAADSARGIREFVVGMGGGSHYGVVSIQPNSQVRNTDTYGVLKLTLHPTSYDWQFVPVAGKTFTDSGSDQCQSAPPDADTVAPTVSGAAPSEGATDVALTANTEVTFSEDMAPNTINTTTFTLTKQGTSQTLTAQVSYDAATRKATLDPNADLDPSTTYLATVKGGATGVNDLVGNPLAEDKTWSFSTAAAPLQLPDITPPETNIDSGPSVTVSDSGSSASFAFSSNEANSTFECSLDGDVFALCASPKSYVNLSEASHTFQVRAIDAEGNTDLTPASRTWTMDTTPPNITNVPSDITKEATSYAGAPVTFTIPTATDAVDGNRTVSCSPDSGSTFSLGLTEVTCSASDTSGNTSSAKFNVTVRDTTAPNIASHADVNAEATAPDGATVNYTKPTATDAVDTSVTVDCLPASGTKFALGDTTVTCSATDNSGNNATQTTFKVTVVPPPPQDTTPPNTTIDSGPSGTIKQNSATFSFSSSEASSTFECKLDSAAFMACSTPKDYTGLASGSHTFSVRATDASGNTDSTPASQTWTVDTTPPPPSACPSSAPTGYLTVSGSPNDEISTGQNVYFPAGSYNVGTSTMNLAAGQKVTGAGRDVVMLSTEGFDVNNNTSVECITMKATGLVSYPDAFTSTHVSGAQTGVLMHNLRLSGYQVGFRVQDWTQFEFSDNETVNTNYALYRMFGPGTVIRGNQIDLGPDLGYSNYKAGIELAGSSDILIENNTITGGIAGIKGLSGYSVAPRASKNVTIRNNTVTGFTEEGISADLRGNSDADNGVREMDRIGSVSGNIVTLQGSYSSSPYGNGYHYLSVYSGACRGETYRITAQILRTFTLESAPTCVPATGDRVSVGVPYIGWTMENNYVDASKGLTALQFWGLSFNSSIRGNQIVEPPDGPPRTGYPPSAISLMSLQGLSGVGQVTNGGSRSANVDGITVSGNTLAPASPHGPRAIINAGNSAWGDCSNFYTPRLNIYTLNDMPVERRDSCF